MAEAERRRARTAEEFGALMGLMMAPEPGQAMPAPYEPRPSDVIITPYGKCGTTWLQQTFHQLRTGGDEDYDDISRVLPWIETAHVHGVDVNAEQRANPRGFKSHLSYHALPKGAKWRGPDGGFLRGLDHARPAGQRLLGSFAQLVGGARQS
ncbi:MAG: sulfotransferase domain-containing protein [Pacificimonas sp.]|jgi:hypothetical protein|nr:sulfotransferase domain-containing protein [Pacificimonas sp.]